MNDGFWVLVCSQQTKYTMVAFIITHGTATFYRRGITTPTVTARFRHGCSWKIIKATKITDKSPIYRRCFLLDAISNWWWNTLRFLFGKLLRRLLILVRPLLQLLTHHLYIFLYVIQQFPQRVWDPRQSLYVESSLFNFLTRSLFTLLCVEFPFLKCRTHLIFNLWNNGNMFLTYLTHIIKATADSLIGHYHHQESYTILLYL